METFKAEELLEPIELYKTRLKDAFHRNAEEKIDNMTNQAGTNVPANQSFCAIYYKEMKIIEGLRKKKNLRIFGLIMCIIFGLASIVTGVLLICKAAKDEIGKGLGIGLGIGLILVFVLLVFLSVLLGMKIAKLKREIEEHQAIADKAKSDAYNELKGLFHLYEWNMAASLMSETIPLIQLDPIFDGEKFQFLNEKYGYGEYHGGDISTVYVQSGSVLGNPFVFEKNYVQSMRDHRYSGTLTITWTERVSDGKGGSRLVTRTQVLTAYYTAPEPYYYLDTWLIYGNEAAPKLSFSRSPVGLNDMNDKEIERYVKRFDKELDKMVQKSLMDDDHSRNFNRLPNEEFEALFKALDRDNEVEFRLLFTPLAQKNMIKLLRGKDVGFGDDFIFKKRKQLNYIKSQHMQSSDSLDRNPNTLEHFDYKVAKQIFVDYCDKFLKDVFFDLAPLMSIPLYQQYKTIEYIYEGKFHANVTQAETESAANSHNVNLFKHPETRSGVILKSDFLKKDPDCDVCNITAYSFKGIDRVQYVPVLGGDGRTHQVPVHWVEYIPIQKVTPFVISNTNKSKVEFESEYNAGGFDKMLNKFSGGNDIIYKKRLFSFVPKDNK